MYTLLASAPLLVCLLACLVTWLLSGLQAPATPVAEYDYDAVAAPLMASWSDRIEPHRCEALADELALLEQIDAAWCAIADELAIEAEWSRLAAIPRPIERRTTGKVYAMPIRVESYARRLAA